MPVSADFDEVTINVMDQIATLLKISRDVRDREEFFRNSVDLRAIEGKPHADRITKFVSEVGTELLQALFQKETKRLEAIADVQNVAADRLPDVIASARTLAEMEINAMIALENQKGRVIETLVVKPLEQLQSSFA